MVKNLKNKLLNNKRKISRLKDKTVKLETSLVLNNKKRSHFFKENEELSIVKEIDKTSNDSKKKKEKKEKERYDKNIKVKNNRFEPIILFLRDVKVEFRKVVWPSRRQAIFSTGIVLILVFIISTFLAAIDFILSSIIRRLIGC